MQVDISTPKYILTFNEQKCNTTLYLETYERFDYKRFKKLALEQS